MVPCLLSWFVIRAHVVEYIDTEVLLTSCTYLLLDSQQKYLICAGNWPAVIYLLKHLSVILPPSWCVAINKDASQETAVSNWTCDFYQLVITWAHIRFQISWSITEVVNLATDTLLFSRNSGMCAKSWTWTTLTWLLKNIYVLF